MQQNFLLDFDIKSVVSEGVLEDSLKELGFNQITSIQKLAIPEGRDMRDLIIRSKAGSGKTLAFISIIFERLLKIEQDALAVIIAPTRELSMQIHEFSQKICKQLEVYEISISSFLFIGGSNISLDTDIVRNLKACGKGLIIGTPGKFVAFDKLLKELKFEIIVLDEADKLMDSNLFDQCNRILAKLASSNTQLIASSATYNEESLVSLLRIGFHKSMYLEPDSTKMPIREFFEIMFHSKSINEEIKDIEDAEGSKRIKESTGDKELLNSINSIKTHINLRFKAFKEENAYNEKCDFLTKYLNQFSFSKCVVFLQDKEAVKNLESNLSPYFEKILSVSSEMRSKARSEILNRLKMKEKCIIIATDLLSRGIDCEGISLVINFDLPFSTSSFFHRISRTGRFGRIGLSICLFSETELTEFKRQLVTTTGLVPEKVFEIMGMKEFNEDEIEFLNEKTGTQMEENRESRLNQRLASYLYDNPLLRWIPIDSPHENETKFKYFNSVQAEKKEADIEIKDEKLILENEEEIENENFDFLECEKCFEMILNLRQTVGFNFIITDLMIEAGFQ